MIRRGLTLAERYAPGYSAQSRFAGWSMSKSVTSALIGVLVSQGRLALGSPAPVPEWASSADPRHAITLDQMLRMSTGLEFDEDYDNPLSDVVWMLYGTGDGAAFAAGKPIVHAPGTTSTTPPAPRLCSPASLPKRPEKVIRCSHNAPCSRRW